MVFKIIVLIGKISFHMNKFTNIIMNSLAKTLHSLTKTTPSKFSLCIDIERVLTYSIWASIACVMVV